MHYLSLVTVEGRGLIITLHQNVWHLGISHDKGKGRVTRHFQSMGSLDAAIEKAAHLGRVWRSRGFGLRSEWVMP